jgi:peptide/nickel transport system permease protein
LTKFLARRLLLGILTLWAITALVFAGTEILPGDVASAVLGQSATEELKAALRIQMGLDRPMLVRYFEWLGRILSGDLGVSLANNYPVDGLVGPRVLNTLYLAIVTAVIAVPLSIGLGLFSAAFPDSLFDRIVNAITLFTVSVPDFLIAIVLIILFSVEMRWFPMMLKRVDFSDFGGAMHALALPVATLMLTMLSHMIRMTRATILDVLRSAYVEMALLKGASKGRIILRHAAPNALAPIVNVIALNLGYLISGVVVIEVVFTYPGLGRLMVDAIGMRDLPLVQITGLIFCATYIVLNIMADMIAIMSNPRIRYAA